MTLRVPILLGEHAPNSPVTFDEPIPKTAAQLSALADGVMKTLGPAEPGGGEPGGGEPRDREPGGGEAEEGEHREEVLVLCRDVFLFAGAMLGAWRAGYRVGLPPNSQPNTVATVRKGSAVKTVLHDGDDVRGIDLRTVEPTAANSGVFSPPPDRSLLSVYTSGSTGEHRRVSKTAQQLLGEAGLLVDTFADLTNTNVLSMVPAHHIYGLLFGVIVPLISGGTFRRTTARGVWEVLECADRGADVLVSVPALLGAFRSAERAVRFQRVFSSGAPLQPPTASALSARLGWTVTEVLGSTETGGIAYRMRSGNEVPAFTTLTGISVRESGEGKMVLSSPLVGASEFVSEDMIQLNPDGSFQHLGRADGVIKIGSTRVSLVEVERHLMSIEGVRDAVVLSQTTAKNRGTELWAVVETDRIDEPAIRAALGKWLNPIVVPRRFRFVKRMPRTERGKASRQDLLGLFGKPGGPE